MRSGLGGPRLLLRKLREVMAEPVGPQVRLDRIVTQIASNMVAEVCSVYVLRSDGRLELFATEGLNREAVHLTTMRKGEGLVGLIAESAEPLALSDAQTHPAFSYKPETGEEVYNAFLGVPMLRGGATLGVLVVQNKARRTYSEEEIEVLQTTSLLIAEMVASGELQSLGPPGSDIVNRGPVSAAGTPIVDGVGLGHVVLHEPRVFVQKLVADDLPAETKRLDGAIEAMRASIDRLIESSDGSGPGEHRDVLETVRTFANDRGWLRRLREAVMTGLTAEGAVEKVQSDARARLQRQTDPYLRERLHDLDDLANRLLRHLTGRTSAFADRANLPENAILVARNMGPAALLDYERANLRGLILEDGGANSHVAIIARALGLATVGEVANITNLVEAGDAIIVDGDAGEVKIRPLPNVVSAYSEKVRLRARRQERYRALRDVPAVTKDGVAVGLHMNAGLLIDIPQLAESGAMSIGLFRTELQFMITTRFPRTDDQYRFYKSVFDALPGSDVTFRTLDIGGDKILPYMATVQEENPALGWRAIRIGLDRPALLRSQLRAMLRAAAGRNLRVMFPMVAEAGEFIRARQHVMHEVAHLERHGHAMPRDVKLGVMIEVPALLWQLDELAEAVDFLSVGSNDLAQYMFAADRDNKRVSGRFDVLSPPFLRALKAISDTGARAGKPVSLCGEIGGKPLEAMALVGLGYRALSMSPASVGPIKAMILELDASAVTALVDECLRPAGSPANVRERLAAFARDNQIPV